MAYPVSIYFMIIYEFCELYTFLGLLGTLSIYFHNSLRFDPDISTVLFHIFHMVVFSFPIVGAVVADSWFGRFKLVSILSVFYTGGFSLLVLGSAITNLTTSRIISAIGLMIVAICSGARKPCVTAFGGDQFALPDQKKELSASFAIMYFTANAGALISKMVTPIIRHDIACFGRMDCYPLAYGTLACSMLISAVVFISGKRWYTIKPPSQNMLVQVIKCISHALKQRRILRRIGDIRDHWLDYSKEIYGEQLISDIKVAMEILRLYIPLPIYWALFNQQGSRWTFQATRMKGDIGSYSLLPDQIQAINPLLCLFLIPLFQYGVYPLLARCKISRPLQKLTIGGILNGVSFIISGIIELQLEPTYAVLPSAGSVQLRIFNGYNLPVSVQLSEVLFIIPALGLYENKNLKMKGLATRSVAIMPQSTSDDEASGAGEPIEMKIKLVEAEAVSLLISPYETKTFIDDVDKSFNGFPAVRMLFTPAVNDISSKVQIKDHATGALVRSAAPSGTGRFIVPPSNYDVFVRDKKIITNYKLALGGVYTVIVSPTEDGDYQFRIHVITEPNSIHILWLIPQYVVLSIGEIMFGIIGPEFTFSQAPLSMKSVLQAFWLLATTLGNVLIFIIVAITSGRIKQSYEFFSCAVLMFGDMVIFILLAMRYKFVEQYDTDNQEQ